MRRPICIFELENEKTRPNLAILQICSIMLPECEKEFTQSVHGPQMIHSTSRWGCYIHQPPFRPQPLSRGAVLPESRSKAKTVEGLTHQISSRRRISRISSHFEETVDIHFHPYSSLFYYNPWSSMDFHDIARYHFKNFPWYSVIWATEVTGIWYKTLQNAIDGVFLPRFTAWCFRETGVRHNAILISPFNKSKPSLWTSTETGHDELDEPRGAQVHAIAVQAPPCGDGDGIAG